MNIQNIPITEIADRYGTPCYLYDQEILKSSYETLRNIFPKPIDIFYSMKANPNLAICKELKLLGACIEVCSLFELKAALKVGFLARNIIFVGPAKIIDELTACLEANICAIVCESLTELKLISELAKKFRRKVNVAIRINPNFILRTAPLKMGGQASQFGIDETLFFSELNTIFNQENINMVGIHIFNGTRLLDAEAISENIKNILMLAERVMMHTDQLIEMLDLGGGLGVPYFKEECALDVEQLKKLITPLLHSFLEKYPKIRVMVESGRFLVADSGLLASRILDKKISKDEIFLLVDAGMHCHMAAVGIGSFVKRNFPISLLRMNSLESTQQEIYNIVDPLCTPGDMIAKKVTLPKASINDLIVIHRSGAYGLTASPIMFLSHGFPAEILIKNQQSHLIRDRQVAYDFFNKQYYE